MKKGMFKKQNLILMIIGLSLCAQICDAWPRRRSSRFPSMSRFSSYSHQAFQIAYAPVVVAPVTSSFVGSTSNTGGGPAAPYDPPNIYDVPWQTAGVRSTSQSLFGSLWSSGRTDGGTGERDATPE